MGAYLLDMPPIFFSVVAVATGTAITAAGASALTLLAFANFVCNDSYEYYSNYYCNNNCSCVHL